MTRYNILGIVLVPFMLSGVIYLEKSYIITAYIFILVFFVGLYFNKKKLFDKKGWAHTLFVSCWLTQFLYVTFFLNYRIFEYIEIEVISTILIAFIVYMKYVFWKHFFK